MNPNDARPIGPREACLAVYEVCNSAFDVLSHRPFNRHRPDESAWWLVPSTDWPAYPHAKFFFSRRDEDQLDVGLFIEKGLDPSVQDAYPSRKGRAHIMTSDWDWARLMDTGATDLLGAIGAITDTTPVEAMIWAAYVPDPGSWDPYAPRFDQASYRFRVEDSGELFLMEDDDSPGHLHSIRSCGSLEELLAGLKRLEKNAWLWIDFFIYCTHPVPPVSNSTFGSQLWTSQLRHFADWLRK